MKNKMIRVRLAALPLALAAAWPVCAQSVLQDVVVTATRLAGPREAQPFGTDVISADDIQKSGATTVNEALMRILGVVGRQDNYGGGNYALDLRGFGTTADSHQVVVVDGVRINEADLSATRLAGIPIESIAQIEVIRGSGAVLYGEGATGGVIIITTKAGQGGGGQNTASVYTGAGSDGLREVRANASVSGQGFSLDINGAKRKADNYRDNFHSDTDAVSVVGQWSNEWLRVGARLSQDSLETGLPGSLTAAQYASNPRQTKKPTDKASIDSNRSGLFAEASLGDWQFAGDVGWREKKLRSVSSSYSYDYDVDTKAYGLRAVNTQKFSALSNRLVLGNDYSRWQRDVLGASGSTATQSSHAWYVRDEVTIAATGTDISAGLRTERIIKSRTDVITGLSDRQKAWELGVRQPITSAVNVYARTGQSFRLANVDEFSFTSPGVSLLPQRSRDVELGTRYTNGPLKFEARWYRSALTHEIGYDGTAPGPFGSGANVNFDPTRRSGVELDSSYAYTKQLNVHVIAGVRKATFTSGPYTGKDVALVPKRTLALRADWQPVVHHTLNGGVNWVSSQHPDFANACTMPSYTTADVRYAYQWDNMELSLAVANLFDRKFYTQAYGCAAGVTTSIYPEAGRTVTAALRVKF